MSFNPPNKLLITSDNNEIQFIKTIPKTKTQKELYRYRFIKSETKLNIEVDFTEMELGKNLGNFLNILN